MQDYVTGLARRYLEIQTGRAFPEPATPVPLAHDFATSRPSGVRPLQPTSAEDSWHRNDEERNLAQDGSSRRNKAAFAEPPG